MPEQPLTLAVNHRDPEEVRVALHRGPKIVDLRWAQGDRPTLVGDIYLGIVRQVEPGLDAAFIDFGERRAGFLHLGNVHPGYADATLSACEVAGRPSRQASQLADDAAGPEAEKSVRLNVDHADLAAPADATETDSTTEAESYARAPRLNIDQLLQPGRQILVQVLRDPVRGKGATLTTILSLAGRLCVLVPSLGRVGVSRRILDSVERARLRDPLEDQLQETGLGAIVRTAAEDVPIEELQRDLAPLLESWLRIQSRAHDQELAPRLLEQEAGPAARAVRELFSADIERIVVDDEGAAVAVEELLTRYAPDHGLTVERYQDRRPLYEALGIERDWQLLFRARVPVGGGASIVIHETEALTAIDVNSGRLDRGCLEETALATNCLAAVEMVRQIRLRDIGGIIVADFIDMQDPEHRRQLEQLMHDELHKDRARFKLGRLSSFGLLPLTRRRQGAGLPRASDALCRDCGGSGSVSHHRGGALRLLRRLRAEAERGGSWLIRLHPGVNHALQAHFQAALAEMELELEFEQDIQVPSGEPVLEHLVARPESL
jgi:ribonuclease E